MIFTIVLALILGVLFILLGRYSLQIRFYGSDAVLGVCISFRSLGSIWGLDYEFPESRLRLIFLDKGIGFLRKKDSEASETGEEAEIPPDRVKTKKRRIRFPSPGRLITEGWPYVKKILRALHFERLALSLHFGTGDPATTGMLYGLAQAVLPTRIERFEAELVPDFIERKLEGKADLAVRFLLIQLIALLIVNGLRLAIALRRS
jgi:hypothetical protein